MSKSDEPQERGDVGGGYSLVERIGRGTFGEVWRSLAPGDIEVAIKIVYRTLDHPEPQQQLRAIDLVKRLRHPFILPTSAFFSYEDRLLIVMELADGNLRDRLNECRSAGMSAVPVAELLRYTREVAEALDYLHDHQVAHRDIKPEHILLVKGHAKVSGLLYAPLTPGADAVVVAPGLGTFGYLAPELWRGTLHRHSDQYALALTYAELRLGREVYGGQTIAEIMEDHLRKTPDLRPLPAPERDVLLWALAKDPEHRFPSCLEFARTLTQAVGKDTRGEPPP